MQAVARAMPERPADRTDGGDRLRLRQSDNAATALGVAVSYLMTRPAFARLTFGHWSRVLVGQINRGHYVFVYDADQVAGFAGWALASAADAQAWVDGNAAAGSGNGLTGDCLVVNAWAANSPAVQRLLADHLHRIAADKRVVYPRRVYRDRRTRPARGNGAVHHHVTMAAGWHDGGGAMPPEHEREAPQNRVASGSRAVSPHA
jgi:hemolysin-activating ACP:hemolysin acyltransferase